ncbi:MAG TPA: acetyl-CoA carboxylase biotin carboxylase subunit, partial [Hyphomonas sp.]|nr:acetyl-CoA carboxylase biotin carboxylase subunit [Hyphomonas sp.]
GRTRRECIMRLRRALQEMVIGGVFTTLDLHRELVENEDVLEGEYNIHWLEKFLENQTDTKK